MSRTTAASLVLLCLLTACKPQPKTVTGTVNSPLTEPDTVNSMPVEAKVGEGMSLSVKGLDGKAIELTALRGQWVVVNMWATWCGPCIEEMPELSALDSMHEDVTVIGLDMEDIPLEDLKAFLEKHPVTYPIAAMDPMQPPAGFGAVQFLPKTWLIDPTGKLHKIFAGPVNAALLRSEIDSATKAKK